MGKKKKQRGRRGAPSGFKSADEAGVMAPLPSEFNFFWSSSSPDAADPRADPPLLLTRLYYGFIAPRN